MSKQKDFRRPEKPLEKTREIDNEARTSKKAEMKRKFNRNQRRMTLWDIQLSSLTSLVECVCFFLIKSSSNRVSSSWYYFIIFDCIIISAVKIADTSYIFNQNIYYRAKWFTILENQFIGNLEFFFFEWTVKNMKISRNLILTGWYL